MILLLTPLFILLSYLLLLSLGALLASFRTHNSSHSLHPGKLAILVPAHNESNTIADTLAGLKKLQDPSNNTEIIVIADNCTDDTAQITQAANIRTLVRDDLSRVGKGYALEFAFNKLLAEEIDLFLIIDADSTASDNFISEIRRAFGTGAPAVQARYQISSTTHTHSERLRQLLFAAFNTVRPMGRSYYNLSCGILGNGFALTAQLLQKQPYVAHSIVEDLEYHLLLVERGVRVNFVPQALVQAPPPPSTNAATIQQSRWEGGRLALIPKWVPYLLRSILKGKWRAIDPLLDLAIPPTTYLLGMIFVVGLFVSQPLQTALYLFAVFTITIYIFASYRVGKLDYRHLIALIYAPILIAKKMISIPKILQSSLGKAKWVRTPRGSKCE